MIRLIFDKCGAVASGCPCNRTVLSHLNLSGSARRRGYGDFAGLLRRMMSFFPVLMNNQRGHNDCQCCKYNTSKVKIIHFYLPPLSMVKVIQKKIKANRIPTINFSLLNPAGETHCPRTTIAIKSLPMSAKIFARFSLCFMFNRILNFRTNWSLCQGLWINKIRPTAAIRTAALKSFLFSHGACLPDRQALSALALLTALKGFLLRAAFCLLFVSFAFALNMKTSFVGVSASGVVPGEEYSLKAHGLKTLKIYNKGTDEITVKFKAVPTALKDGFEALPDAKWINFEKDSVDIAPDAFAELDVIISVPKESKYYGRSFSAVILSAGAGKGGNISAGLRSKLYVTTVRKKRFWQKIKGIFRGSGRVKK